MGDQGRTRDELMQELAETRERLAVVEALEKRHREELEKLDHDACFDHLTGLPTGSVFYNHVRYAVAHADRTQQQAAVLFCSLDRFKLVNDMFGNAIGDVLLKEVASRLKDCLRKSDVLSRPGRDEFMILLTDLKRIEDATQVVERFFASLNEPFLVQQNRILINAGIGITVYPHDGTTPDHLIRNAYTAMGRAKEEGKNEYRFYSPAITDKAFKRLMMENSLRFAVQRDEFYLHYQPQIDMGTGRMVGMEALLRWRHPELGCVMPGDFIPLVEEMGLIVPLTERVLAEACAHNKACQQNNFLPMRVAVNLSSCQLHKKDLTQTVQQVLKESGLDPQFLELEVTERSLVSNIDSTVETLNALAGMGVSIAIDDFGKGYSSLAYLRYFPIDKLKIDRFFVESLTTDLNSAAITKAIIALAQSLGLGVIAEGVETVEQMDILRTLSCSEAQGYLFCHPLPAGEIVRLLAEKRKYDRGRGNCEKEPASPSFWLQRHNDPEDFSSVHNNPAIHDAAASSGDDGPF